MKKLLSILTFLLLLISAGRVGATHLVGSDITYKCLGNGKYEVTVTVYRDCNGVTLSNSALEINCATGAGGFNQVLPNVSVKDITGIDQRCTTQSRCSGSYPYGIEEHVFTGVVDLSALNCCEVRLGWQQSARSSLITTGAADQNFYTYALLNKCINPCNSSPQFSSKPAALVCLGQDFVFNNGALDTIDNGDSLSYELAEPLSGFGSPIGYSGSWSYLNPITYLGFPMGRNLNFPAGFHMDSTTGDISFRPTAQNQITVMVLQVTEWRKINGVMTKVGVTRRDMQIIVVNCPNNKVPKIAGRNEVACAGQQVCIDITTDDPDNNDTVKISWNRGIPRATFAHTNGAKRLATGSVCWTPGDADVSSTPYTFTITAKDDACPLAGQSIKAFSITVRESPKATREINKLICGRVAIDFTPAKNYPGLLYEWVVKDSNNKSIAFSNKKKDTIRMQPGVNRLFLTLKTATCANPFVDTVIIDPFVQVILPEDTFICAGNPMDLQAQTKYGTAPFVYNWNVAGNVDNVTVNPGKDSAFWISVKDDAGCENSDTIKVTWKPLPPVGLGPDARICFDQIKTLEAIADSTANKLKLKFLWSNGQTTRDIVVKDSNQYTVKVTDTIGCNNFDTMTLFVNTVPVEIGPNLNVCNKDTAKITATGADSYVWYSSIDNYGSPASSTEKYNFTVMGNSEVRVKATRTWQGLTCTNWDTLKVTLVQLPQIIFSPVGKRCVNDNPFNLTFEAISSPTITNGTWSHATNPNIINGSFFNPKEAGANITPGHTIKYTVTDGNGCTNSATTSIPINPLPVVKIKDMSYCGYDPQLNLFDLITQGTGFNFGRSWSSEDPQAQSAIVQGGFGNWSLNISQLPQGQTYDVILRLTDNNTTCSNYDTAEITIREVPLVEAGLLPDMCQNDASIDLDNTPNLAPKGGTWSQKPGGLGLEAGHFFNPDLPDSNNSQNWVYYTYDIPGNNCPVTDSVRIRVKPRPNVYISDPGKWCEDAGAIQLAPHGFPLNGDWSGEGGVGPGGQFNATTAGPGTYKLNYFYRNPLTGCTHEASSEVIVQERPTLTVDVPKAACAGEIFSISASYTIATGVLWERLGDGNFDGGANQPTSTNDATQYAPGTQDITDEKFTIRVQTTGPDAVCTPEIKEFEIGIFPIPTAVITGNPLIECEPEPVTFTAVTSQPTGAEYEWSFGDPASGSENTSSSANPTHTYENDGVYTVT
ncbi:MAG TPA: PKD domain-containing protein, partial [Bacteroidia bacterium]|nr:PKD domain-containing protein [Bacteroidia bacterium]